MPPSTSANEIVTNQKSIPPITGDPEFSMLLITQLADALGNALADPVKVRQKVQDIESHAPSFPEVRFCKGCVLPILDSVATKLLRAEHDLPQEQIRSSLLCEGYTTLPNIYSPDQDQSGFGGFTWGENRQLISKSGQAAPDGKPGSLPCPDFGILSSDHPGLALLGEVKYASQQSGGGLTKLINELRYYMAIPIEPDKRWHYNYGVGIFFAAAGYQLRRTRLITDYWRSDRFALIAIHA